MEAGFPLFARPPILLRVRNLKFSWQRCWS